MTALSKAAAVVGVGESSVGRVPHLSTVALQRAAAEAALADADVLVMVGGASRGDRDLAKAALAPLGLDIAFADVAIKPGKPVWLGRVGSVLVMGLPGNPTSALVTARLLLAPLIAGLTGRDPAEALPWRSLPLCEALNAAGDRETFSRACWNGEKLHLLFNQDSGAQKTLAAANLLVRRPAGSSGFAAGDHVDVLDF